MTSSQSHIARLSKALTNFFSYFLFGTLFESGGTQNEKIVSNMLTIIICIPLVISGIFIFAQTYTHIFPSSEGTQDKEVGDLNRRFGKKLITEADDLSGVLGKILKSLSFILKPIYFLIETVINIGIWLYQNPFRVLMVTILVLYIWLSSSFSKLYNTNVTLDKWSNYLNFIIITFGIALGVSVFTLFSDNGNVSIFKKPQDLKNDGIFNKFRWMMGDSIDYYKSILMVLVVVCVPLFILWLISSFSFISTPLSLIIGLCCCVALLYLIYSKFNAYKYKTNSWIMKHANIFSPTSVNKRGLSSFSGGGAKKISYNTAIGESLSSVITNKVMGRNQPTTGDVLSIENASMYIKTNWKKTENNNVVTYEEVKTPSIFSRILKVLMSFPSIFMDTIKNVSSIPTGAWIILFIELFIIASYFLLPLIPKFLYTHSVSKKDDLLKEQNEIADDKNVIEKENNLNQLLNGVSVDWEKILSAGLYKKNLQPTLKKYLEQQGYVSIHNAKKPNLFQNIKDKIFNNTLTLEAAITYVQTNGPVIINLRNQVKMLNSSRWKSSIVKKDEDNMFKTKILLEKPIYTDKKTNIGGYEDIGSAVGSFNYNYAISAWMFIHNQPPSRSKSQTEYTSILNYANKPNILFNGEKNTLRITMDDSLDRKTVIYETEDFSLQKWNNIVVNYNGGTLDIFINGKLVSSTSSIVPFMTYDAVTVGSDGGISGGICNVTYFPAPLSLSKIKVFYKSLKNKNPPIV